MTIFTIKLYLEERNQYKVQVIKLNFLLRIQLLN